MTDYTVADLGGLPTGDDTPVVRAFVESVAGKIAEPVNHLEYLLGETYRERQAQIERFGHQRHPMVRSHWYALTHYEAQEARYKHLWGMQDRDGEVTWDVVLLEEAYEALAERVPAKQIEELVQVAAVALAMAEDLMTRDEEGS